jgi:hypothetical protein
MIELSDYSSSDSSPVKENICKVASSCKANINARSSCTSTSSSYLRRGAATAAAIISSTTNSNTKGRALQLQSAARSNRGK